MQKAIYAEAFFPLFLEINENTKFKVYLGSRNLSSWKTNPLALLGRNGGLTCHFSARSVSECSSLYSQTGFNTSAEKQVRAHLTADFQGKYAPFFSLCRTSVFEGIKVLTEILPPRENRLEVTRPVAAMEQSIFNISLINWHFHWSTCLLNLYLNEGIFWIPCT